MGERQRRSLRHHWRLWAHDGQLPPAGDWLAWLILAGRGFGKTRAGAEWVRAIAEADGSARIDGLLYCAIEGEANAPPANPGGGQAWLVGAAPTGPWTGQAGAIAIWQSGNWLFQAPRPGLRLLNRSTGQDIRFTTAWQSASRPPTPTGGTTVDAQARTALAALYDSLTIAGVLPAA
ncbi:MAG: DUF2793 domain-containing protein [Novosphingobium sp.]|nr:DUF2793 domain-containing protein [Novosphingobium sp.]